MQGPPFLAPPHQLGCLIPVKKCHLLNLKMSRTIPVSFKMPLYVKCAHVYLIYQFSIIHHRARIFLNLFVCASSYVKKTTQYLWYTKNQLKLFWFFNTKSIVCAVIYGPCLDLFFYLCCTMTQKFNIARLY